MSVELKSQFEDADITLYAEGKGIFDVVIEGTLVYSKYETHRFPGPGEVIALMAS
ncbi:MAG: hypothetical protein ACI8Z1_002318 [Candidatus Azotimanducaceae bacterium]